MAPQHQPSISSVCLDCGFETSFTPLSSSCPNCAGQWQEAHYNYTEIAKVLPDLSSSRPFDLWRYRELLPIYSFNPRISIGEGGTPLIHADNLGMMLGCPHIYLKDERQGPTHSFKDRQAAVGIAAAKEAGITEMVLASTGNVAIAYSAYAARAGIKLWAFLTSLVPAEKMREVALYGTQVIKVTGSYDQAKQLAAEFARQRGLYLERGPRSIPPLESMKTIAYEIAEQLSLYLQDDSSHYSDLSHLTYLSHRAYGNPVWRAPDWYFQSVSGGLGPYGVLKGFYELFSMGLTDKIPAIAIIQAEGCAPMVSAWKNNLEVAEPIRNPRTHIATLSTGDPGRTYTLLRNRMLHGGGGVFESATDQESFRTMHVLAKMEGISVEPAAAVAFAGLIKLVRSGIVKPTDVVVVNCTGHTMPVENAILGDQWGKEVTAPASSISQTPQEGILAALNRVTADRYPRIVIVDDTPDARRLIRRILQSQGDYTLFEASNGTEAIQLIQKERPDLIILDLMMPEIDGFAVLDRLKSNPETAHIPVIVVTAKELTFEEKSKLGSQIHSLMQKGEFMSDDLLEEVSSLIAQER